MQRGCASSPSIAARMMRASSKSRARPRPQRDEILRNYPWTKTLLSFVVRMAREPLRGAPRSVANLEFHRAGHEVDRDRRGNRRQARGARHPRGQSLHGLSHGDVSEPEPRLGRLAQAHRGRGGARPHGHSPQPDPSEVRQLRAVGHGADRCRCRRVRPPHRLQPVPRMQAVRRGLPGRRDRPGRLVQFLVLLHPQLSRVPRRLLRLGRAGRRRARCASITAAASTNPRPRPCGRA